MPGFTTAAAGNAYRELPELSRTVALRMRAG